MSNIGVVNIKIQKIPTSEGRTRRLLQEKRKVFDGASNRSPTSLKTPQEALFADEEAEAGPAESEVFCRSECMRLTIIRITGNKNVTMLPIHRFIAITTFCGKRGL